MAMIRLAHRIPLKVITDPRTIRTVIPTEVEQ